ncbi:twin-arginine translocation signal domain-containing protein, partial [Chryseobacterium artocarpi]
MENNTSRRSFIKTAALASFGALVLPNSMFAYSNDFKADKKVRVGFI